MSKIKIKPRERVSMSTVDADMVLMWLDDAHKLVRAANMAIDHSRNKFKSEPIIAVLDEVTLKISDTSETIGMMMKEEI